MKNFTNCAKIIEKIMYVKIENSVKECDVDNSDFPCMKKNNNFNIHVL